VSGFPLPFRAYRASNTSDIFIPLYVRPVTGQNFPTVRVDFHLPHNLDAGAFKPQVEPAHA